MRESPRFNSLEAATDWAEVFVPPGFDTLKKLEEQLADRIDMLPGEDLAEAKAALKSLKRQIKKVDKRRPPDRQGKRYFER
jgi:hypothetical protein